MKLAKGNYSKYQFTANRELLQDPASLDEELDYLNGNKDFII